jgi:hypothetical protein
MYEHLSECRILLQNAASVVCDSALRIAELSVATIENGTEKTFLFVDGEAVLRAVDKGILMRVVATDVISYFGIRTALEGSILLVAASPPNEFAWHPADQTPFAAIERVLPSKDEVNETRDTRRG